MVKSVGPMDKMIEQLQPIKVEAVKAGGRVISILKEFGNQLNDLIQELKQSAKHGGLDKLPKRFETRQTFRTLQETSAKLSKMEKQDASVEELSEAAEKRQELNNKIDEIVKCLGGSGEKVSAPIRKSLETLKTNNEACLKADRDAIAAKKHSKHDTATDTKKKLTDAEVSSKFPQKDKADLKARGRQEAPLTEARREMPRRDIREEGDVTSVKSDFRMEAQQNVRNEIHGLIQSVLKNALSQTLPMGTKGFTSEAKTTLGHILNTDHTRLDMNNDDVTRDALTVVSFITKAYEMEPGRQGRVRSQLPIPKDIQVQLDKLTACAKKVK